MTKQILSLSSSSSSSIELLKNGTRYHLTNDSNRFDLTNTRGCNLGKNVEFIFEEYLNLKFELYIE